MLDSFSFDGWCIRVRLVVKQRGPHRATDADSHALHQGSGIEERREFQDACHLEPRHAVHSGDEVPRAINRVRREELERVEGLPRRDRVGDLRACARGHGEEVGTSLAEKTQYVGGPRQDFHGVNRSRPKSTVRNDSTIGI